MRPGSSRIGVLSDTHGLLRPEALRVLDGVELILHAGDIGDPEVLVALRGLAPVVAVRGNDDRGPWADALPATELVEVQGACVYLLHDLADLAVDPQATGLRVVVSGHSHRPSVVERDGVLYVNPGSAGPRRFTLPVTVARLLVVADTVHAAVCSLL